MIEYSLSFREEGEWKQEVKSEIPRKQILDLFSLRLAKVVRFASCLLRGVSKYHDGDNSNASGDKSIGVVAHDDDSRGVGRVFRRVCELVG